MQVVPDRRTADARPQQHAGGLQRARRHDHLRAAHGHARAAVGRAIRPHRLHARRSAMLDDHALGEAPDQEAGAPVGRVLQVRA